MTEITWKRRYDTHYTAWDGDKCIAHVRNDTRQQVWLVNLCTSKNGCRSPNLCGCVGAGDCPVHGTTLTLEEAKQYTEDLLAGRNKNHKMWCYYDWENSSIVERTLEWRLDYGRKFYYNPKTNIDVAYMKPTLEEAIQEAEKCRETNIKDAEDDIKAATDRLTYWENVNLKVVKLDESSNITEKNT